MKPAAPTGITFGTDAPSYMSQTQADFAPIADRAVRAPPPTAAGVKRAGAAAPPGAVPSRSVVLGYEAPSYETETASRFTRPPHAATAAGPSSPRKSASAGAAGASAAASPPSAVAPAFSFGTDDRIFTTTHRDGFPPRALQPGITTASKEATLEVNRAHFALGYEAPSFATTYREAVATVTTAAAAAAAAAASSSSGGDGAAGMASKRLAVGPGGTAPAPGAASITFGTEAAEYVTTNAMPLHTMYRRGPPVDPTKHAGA